MLPCVSFNSRAAGGVSGQTRAALAAGGVQVQVITDVRLSVTLFLYNLDKTCFFVFFYSSINHLKKLRSAVFLKKKCPEETICPGGHFIELL